MAGVSSIDREVPFPELVEPALLVIGYGLFRWRMRKARKKAMEGA